MFVVRLCHLASGSGSILILDVLATEFDQRYMVHLIRRCGFGSLGSRQDIRRMGSIAWTIRLKDLGPAILFLRMASPTA
jgi:hypothetical protein